MGAELVHQPEPAGAVANRDQPFGEKLDRTGGQFGRGNSSDINAGIQ